MPPHMREKSAREIAVSLDPITLQVMTGGLRAVCEEMGAALIRSAHSANIKERHDCSTALFDARGELVMQAEHIPVHLGSMPDAVAAVLDEEHRPGVAWILNDPYRGGTHLPDITLISPVFAAGDRLGFAACRAHHADVGGPTPGRDAGRLEDARRRGRRDPAHPGRRRRASSELAARMRAPEQRLADLRAQRAANRIGGRRLAELAERHGLERLRAGMDGVLAYAERRTRAALAALPDGAYAAEDVLEATRTASSATSRCGSRRRSRATTSTLDFTGTDQQVDGNLNCPLSVTQVGGLLRGARAHRPRRPASAGAYRPVEVVAPAGCVLNARTRRRSPPATSRPRAASPTS